MTVDPTRAAFRLWSSRCDNLRLVAAHFSVSVPFDFEIHLIALVSVSRLRDASPTGFTSRRYAHSVNKPPPYQRRLLRPKAPKTPRYRVNRRCSRLRNSRPVDWIRSDPGGSSPLLALRVVASIRLHAAAIGDDSLVYGLLGCVRLASSVRFFVTLACAVCCNPDGVGRHAPTKVSASAKKLVAYPSG